MTIENAIEVYRARGDGAPAVRRVVVRALAETGTPSLLIPADLAAPLELRTIRQDRYELADGSTYRGEVIGPAHVTVEGRSFFYEVGLLPPGAEALLGVVTLEQLDPVLDPRAPRLTGRREGGALPPLKRATWSGCP